MSLPLYLSFAISLFIAFFQKNALPDPKGIALAIVAFTLLFVLIEFLCRAMSWTPLQKAEKDFTPGLLKLHGKDLLIRLLDYWLMLFPLISFAIAADLLYLNYFPKGELVSLWVFCFGISIFSLFHYYKRVAEYLNPSSVIDHFSRAAKQSIAREEQEQLCDWIDAETEAAIKGAQRSSLSLTNQAIGTFPDIMDNYFQTAKINPMVNKENYTLYYILQRLQMVFHKALELRLEPVCRFAINIAGKIAILAAKYDITLATPPISFLGEFAIAGQKAKMGDIGDYASCVLLEVAKKILTEVDITYLEIRDTFFTLISQLEDISKEAFRQDRDISMRVLNQPLEQLRALFETEALTKHQDTPIILQDIGRVTGEFDALGMVLRTVPPIPKTEE